MRYSKVLNRWLSIVTPSALLVSVLLVSGCQQAAQTPSPSPTTTSVTSPTPAPATTSPAPTDPTSEVKIAVRAYSDAFLGGDAKTAWLLRTKRAQSKDTYVAFKMGVAQAKAIYGDAKMTSLVVTVKGDTALATYKYDLSDINQKNQKWVKQGGKWLVDN